MSGGSKKKSGGKKSGSTKGLTQSNKTNPASINSGNEPNHESSSNPLVRSASDHSIVPRNILTGFYQKNGKRVQHTVQDGALQMPKDALNVIEIATAKLGSKVKSNPHYDLPGLDYVVRPCLDPKLEELIVTDLAMEKIQIPQEQAVPAVTLPSGTGVPGAAVKQPVGIPAVKMIKTSRPVAKNRCIRRSKRQVGIAADRIRGGGDFPKTEWQEQQHQSGMVASMDIDQAEVASVDPQGTFEPSTVGGLIVPPSHSVTTDGTNNIATATQPAGPADKALTTDTILPTKEFSNPPTVISKGKDLGKIKNPRNDTIGATVLAKSTVNDVETTATNALNDVTLQKVNPTSICLVHSETQTPGPSIVPSVNTSTSASTVAPSSNNNETPLKQPVFAAPSASTNTQNEGDRVVKIQTTIQPSQNVVKPIKTNASAAVGFPNTPKSSITNTVVASTANSTAEMLNAPSILNKVLSNESSQHPTGGTDETATTPVIPVVASSPQTVWTAPRQMKQEEEKQVEELPEAKVLTSKPAPQWTNHKPGQNDETITSEDQLPPKPDWYKKESINDIERTMLPEWFDASSVHRSPETYVAAREKIIEMSQALSNRNVTNAMIRRSIVGDVGSLHRLRNFLVNWGIINRDGINDSAPTTASLRPELKRRAKFTDNMRDSLLLAVSEEATKRRKLALSSNTSLSLDWREIAYRVGHGVSAKSCLDNFMTTSLKEGPSNETVSSEDPSVISDRGTSEVLNSNQHDGILQDKFIKNLVENSNPETLRKVFDTAIEASNADSVETCAASLLGIHLTQAIDDARGHEIGLALRLSKLLEARMQKLENRMAMLDDVEGILEAEKVALEMERRDLYTARCRHWFGGV